MANRNIKSVESNQEKRNTYSKLMGKYKSVIENGFYGEAELIVYAYMKDGLRCVLYKMRMKHPEIALL